MALGVEFALWRLACSNGAIHPDAEVTISGGRGPFPP